MERIKTGIVGCGAVTELCHLPSLRKVPIFKIVYLCDVDVNRAEHLKKKFCLEDCKISNDFTEIINRTDVEAILVLTPPKFHAKICIEASRSDKHVFCEKPFTLTLAEANNVGEVVKETNAKFMIGFNYRFKPENLKVKELLSSRYIGRIENTETYFLNDVRLWPSVSKFQYRKKEGGGALFEMGCHHIDLLSWYLGRIKSVAAKVESKVLQSVDDEAEVRLEFENGSTAEVHVGWVSSVPRYEMNFTGENGDISIRGEEVLMYLKNKFIFKHGPLKLALDRSRGSYQRELLHFGRCIINGEQPRPGISEAIDNMRVITTAYESSDLGKRIDIKE